MTGPRAPWPRWAWLVPAASVAPFALLIPLAFPQLDDFCIGGLWQDLGLYGMLEFLYRTFVGRLFANTVNALPFVVHDALGIDLVAGYRLICGAVLAAALALAFWTVGRLFPSARGSDRLFLALALGAALVAGSPAPNDLYFWVSQIGNYTLAAMVAFAAMLWLWRDAERGGRLGMAATAVIAVAGFLTAMATEMSGEMLFVIVVGALVRRRLEAGAPRQVLSHLVILAAIVAGSTLVAVAPGNIVRMSAYGRSPDLISNAFAALPMTLVRLLNYCYLRLVSPALVAWPVVVALATWHYDRRADVPPPSPPRLAVWLPLITVLAATAGAFWIGQMGMGHFLPPRARSHLHFVLVAGLSLTTIAATRAYGRRVQTWIASRWPGVTAERAAIATLVLIIAAPHALSASWTLLTKRTVLSAAIDQRFSALESGRGGAAGLTLAPLPGAWPVVISDIEADAGAWPNICLARYYRVPSVRIDDQAAGAAPENTPLMKTK